MQSASRLIEPPGGCELVIVDNGSTDGTSEVIRTFSQQCRLPVVQVHEPRPGLGRARNAGIAHSQGTILAFTDDDCYVTAEYLVQICHIFEQEEIGYMGGRVTLHDPSDARVTIKESSVPARIRPRTYVRAGSLHGANMAFRRNLVEEIGGFDSRLGAGTMFPCEDVDMFSRAAWAGWAGCYDPRPVVSHHHGRKPGLEIEQLYRSYTLGKGAYFAKALLDPERRRTYFVAGCRNLLEGLFRLRFRYCARMITGALLYWRSPHDPEHEAASDT